MDLINYTKYFTSQQIARKYDGIIYKIIEHLLKLEFRFNYEYDHDTHISSIASWTWEIKESIKEDESANEAKVMGCYMKNNNFVKVANKITKEFRKNYNFNSIVTLDDIESTLPIVSILLSKETRSKMIIYLNEMYPDKVRTVRTKEGKLLKWHI